ncbi:MAG: VOC family protein [Pseudomonadales bacterium]|nr:VOC family protein [Pseudomonadales bacterium]MCP5184705.1 VOC family protein [Pseudomonadales bacterium]
MARNGAAATLLTAVLLALGAPAVAEQAMPRLGAVGIGVRDIDRSRAFYSGVFGLQVLRTYHFEGFDEVVMGDPSGGTTLVLMHWPGDTSRRYDGRDVKLVFDVADPAAMLERIRAHGGVIDQAVTTFAGPPPMLVGMGRDPDGYVVEVLRR